MAVLDSGFRVVTPKSGYTDGRTISYKTANLSIETDYTNYTGNELYLKTQNNIVICVDPNSTTASIEETRPHLEVKLTYHIHSNDGILGSMQALNALVNNNHLLSDDAEALRIKLNDLYTKDASRSNKLNFYFSVFKRILDDDLRRTKITFIREIDAVVMKDKSLLHIPHPNSNEGLHQAEVLNDKRYHNQAGVFVRVIDTEMLASVRYFYSGKQLISVPSCSDSTSDNGVYCTISSMAADGLITATTEHMSFKEAEEKIGLYRSKEEAITHGDPEMAIRAEEARNKAEESRNKAEERRLTVELNDLKHKASIELLNKEEELSRQKHIVEMLKQESTHLKESLEIKRVVRDDSFENKKRFREDHFDDQKRYREDYYDSRDHRRSDYYDERSHSRKDTSELIKFIPALLLGAAGTFMVLRGKNN